MGAMGCAINPSNCFERKQTGLNPKRSISPLLAQSQKPSITPKDLLSKPAQTFLPMCNFWSILCNFCAIDCQLLSARPACLYPRKMFSELHGRCQKPMSPTKNLIPKAQFSTIIHKFAQFCTILRNFHTISKQSAANCFIRKQTNSSSENRFSPILCTTRFPPCTRKNSPTRIHIST